jgi:Family of unknown function (DUF5694)
VRHPILAVVALIAPVAGHAATPAPCPAGRVPLMILGTFHMEGSSQDMVSAPPEDMSTPRRQAEIADLVARLADFRPTKVAVESSRISSYWNEHYTAWRKDHGELGFNEIEQVGFRLAERAGLEALSPVDYPMWMDGTTAAERHDPPPDAATAAPEPESPLMATVRAQVAADGKVLAAGTVSDYLIYLNRPERAVQSHRWDVISNLAPGKGSSMYETTDYATNWYKRNLRIYTNLVDIAGPGERIMLLIGAGHAHLLGQLAADDPRFCLATVAEVLGGN